MITSAFAFLGIYAGYKFIKMKAPPGFKNETQLKSIIVIFKLFELIVR